MDAGVAVKFDLGVKKEKIPTETTRMRGIIASTANSMRGRFLVVSVVWAETLCGALAAGGDAARDGSGGNGCVTSSRRNSCTRSMACLICLRRLLSSQRPNAF